MRTLLLSVTATLIIVFLSACSTSPKTEGGKLDLRYEAEVTIAKFKESDPTSDILFKEAYGWAVFPTVGKGAVGVGGAYGRGVLYEKGEVVGYCDLTQGSVGFQLGGQAYSEILFFEYKEAMDHFKTGNYAFAAQASAVAITAGASADAKYDRGVMVFTMTKAGLMFEASVGGQKFSYEPMM